jgi:type III restriction enzyme
MDLPEIDYQEHADLLYKLAGQVVDHIRARHGTDDKVLRVLLYSRGPIVSLVADQMQRHYVEHATRYEVTVTRGFEHLEAQCCTVAADEEPRNLRLPVANPSAIRGMLFTGVRRCLYSMQRFQADPERQFAVLLEDADSVLKWAKPKDGAIRITWKPDGRHEERQYNPDFVVEAKDRCFLVEVKQHTLMTDPEVQAKARAATLWCERASEHARGCGGKPWTYLLVPHTATGPGATFEGLVSRSRG